MFWKAEKLVIDIVYSQAKEQGERRERTWMVVFLFAVAVGVNFFVMHYLLVMTITCLYALFVPYHNI